MRDVLTASENTANPTTFDDDDDDDDDDGDDDRRSQAGNTHGNGNRCGPAGVALAAVGTHLATNTVGEVSATRKISAVAGTECLVPSILVDSGSNHGVDRRSLSVTSVLVSGRSNRFSSSYRLHKRVMFAEDTPASAYVSECSRSTQRPRHTSLSVVGDDHPENSNKKQLRGTALLACRSHPFPLFFSSRRVQISGSVDDYPVSAITVDTVTDVSFLMPG